MARPASVEQERHWLADQFRDRSATPLLGVVAVSSDRIDSDLLEASFTGLTARYDALSAGVTLVGDEGLVAPGAPPPFVRLATENGRLADDVRVQAREWLNLAKGPVAVGMHVELPAADAVAIVAHPAICDHASLSILVDELAHGYAAGQGADAPRPDTTFSFIGQRPSVSEEPIVLEERFRGCDLSIELPYGPSGTTAGLGRAVWIPVELAEHRQEMLSRLATELGADVTAVMVTAFQTLLQKLARTTNIVVGVEVDRRPSPRAVGPYTDLALLRPEREETSFRAAISHTAQSLEQAADEFPVRPTVLSRLLQLELGPGRPELASTAVVIRPPLPTLTVGSSTWVCRRIEDDFAAFALALVDDQSRGPSLAQAAVDDARAHTVVRMFGALLAHGLDAPDTPLSQLDPLDADEYSQLLRLRDNRRSVPSPPQLVHCHVARIARTRPADPAVVRGTDALSYRELDVRSNQLAHRLNGLGAGEGTPVLVRLPRSPDLLVAVLAIHKCRSAAVTVDPREPDDRVGRIVGPLAVRLAVAATPQPIAGRTVLLDGSWSAVANEPTTAPEPAVDLDATAFIAVTSGSTARPKFVDVTHRSISHHAEAWAARHDVRAGDRGMWLAPLQTGIGVLEYARFLVAGAAVHVADVDIAASPVELRDWIVASGVTHGFVVPQTADALQRLEWPGETALRILLVGGDTVQRWASPDLPFEMSTGYGATEAAQICDPCARSPRLTSKTIGREQQAAPPPLGYPIEDTEVIVVDKDLHLVPLGVPGELCVAGPMLARGYYGDPAATAERFVPDPFANGGRMYRTGDLVRWRLDGLLDRLGRIGTLVKIHGFRVDPGEVESTLLRHPAVREATVVAWQLNEWNTRLAAYVVCGGATSPGALQAFVADRLPTHMVPARVVVLDRMPLLATGKVDRMGLPEPNWSRPHEREEYTAPRDELEETVVASWREVLDVEGVGVNDRFFELGGDSLSAGKVVTHLRSAVGVDLKLRDLFLAPTPARLAARIEVLQANVRNLAIEKECRDRR